MHGRISRMRWSVDMVHPLLFTVEEAYSTRSGTISILPVVCRPGNSSPQILVCSFETVDDLTGRKEHKANCDCHRWSEIKLPRSGYPLSAQAGPEGSIQDHHQPWIGADGPRNSIHWQGKLGGIDPEPKTWLYHQQRNMVSIWDLCYLPGGEGIWYVLLICGLCGAAADFFFFFS